MKLSSLFAISILLCIFVASFSVLSPVSAAANLAISGVPNHLKDLDEDLYYVWGEVRNDGDVPAGSVWITVEFVEYEGFPIAVGGGEPMLSVIHPGETSPFEIQYSGPEVEEIEDYNFEFEFSPTNALPTGLEIVSNSSDSPGNIVGEIQNIGTEPTTQITVAASFYGASGLVGTASTSIPSTLDPGENATFSIALEYSDLVPEVESYALTAQSQEYAVIPEFPMWISMLLILITLTVATAIYKRRLLKTPIH
ncbi:MAG: FxLYD domain-containing protein [Candidatus Bathyarchaeota archaeon]|nr:FxLYD domain-containing protein [Candidatus Bathyarchaeota archaeon]